MIARQLLYVANLPILPPLVRFATRDGSYKALTFPRGARRSRSPTAKGLTFPRSQEGQVLPNSRLGVKPLSWKWRSTVAAFCGPRADRLAVAIDLGVPPWTQ